MTDSLGNIPRYALFRGRKVRIAYYDDGKFGIIDTDDSQREVTRQQLIFLKEKKK